MRFQISSVAFNTPIIHHLLHTIQDNKGQPQNWVSQKLILRGLESVISVSILSCPPKKSSICPPESCRRCGTILLLLLLNPWWTPPTRLPIAVRIDGLTSLGARYVFCLDFFGGEEGGAASFTGWRGAGGCGAGCTGWECPLSSPLPRLWELEPLWLYIIWGYIPLFVVPTFPLLSEEGWGEMLLLLFIVVHNICDSSCVVTTECIQRNLCLRAISYQSLPIELSKVLFFVGLMQVVIDFTYRQPCCTLVDVLDRKD